jgi:20S proteasome alpha/beta subunit
MTICIGAISDNKDIIAITDRKITVNPGVNSAYEITENKKAVQLTENCVALFAGNIANANSILNDAISKIKPNDSVQTIGTKIQNAHNEKLRTEIDQQILQKYGLDLTSFSAQQRLLDPTFVTTTIQTINQGNLGVEILIVGKDSDVPRLIKMALDGSLEDGSHAGQMTIGSGSGHAQLSLIESEVHAGITGERLVYAIIKAKKRAEYDPNVGHMSELLIINDGIHFVADAVVDKIWEEYDKSTEEIEKTIDKSRLVMQELIK